MRDPSIPGHERVYAIGDTHGCYALFQQLVGMIRRDSAQRGPARVRLILLGDLIDRGPQPARLVERCMALAAGNEDFTVLRGNHEQAMLDALDGNLVALGFWREFGGDATLRSWRVPDALITGDDLPALLAAARARVPVAVLAWLRGLPLTCRIGDYLFVHAGIRPGRRIGFQTANDLLWIREDFLDSDADLPAMVVHGHTECDDAPEVRCNRIGIDAGAYRTGRLLALGLERNERWIVAAETPASAQAAWPVAAARSVAS